MKQVISVFLLVRNLASISIILISCSESHLVKECDVVTEDNDSTKSIRISVADKSVAYTSQIISNPVVIKLQSNSENIVGRVGTVDISDSSIYILDENGVLFSFDASGRVKYKLNLNRIKDEKIADWKYDHSSKTHYLWNDMQKQMFAYSDHGTFKSKVNIPGVYSTSFVMLDTANILFYNDYNSGNKYKAALYNYSLRDNKIVQTSLSRPNVRDGSFFSLNSSPLSMPGKEAYFFDMYKYNIYEIPSTINCPELIFHLSFGKNGYSSDLMDPSKDSRRMELLRMGSFFRPSVFAATDRCFYLEGGFEKLIRKIFVDRRTKKILQFTTLESDLKNIKGIFINDIRFAGNKIVLVVYPGTVYDRINSLREENKKITKELYDFQSKNKIYDNPILIIGNYGVFN